MEVAAVLKTSSLGIRFHLSGRADVVSPAGVWEVKTCSPMRDAPARSHLLQLYFYMKALGIDSGRLLYVNPEDGEERELPLETAALARLWRTFLRGPPGWSAGSGITTEPSRNISGSSPFPSPSTVRARGNWPGR